MECIYRLSLKNIGRWVKNKDISERLEVKAPSVSNMMEKLEKNGFIDWTPRRGIRLTEKGKKRAKDIILNHIVIELFLEHALGYTDKEKINEIACDLEHHLDEEFTEKLMDLLDIEPSLKNVDNFILEDKHPTHIEPSHIIKEKTLKKHITTLKEDIAKTIPQENTALLDKIMERIDLFEKNIIEDSP